MILRVLSLVLALPSLAALAATEVAPAERAISAGPADVRAGAPAARATLVAPALAASRRLTLGSPTTAELAQLRVQDKRAPLAIGIGRAVGRAVPLAELAWQETATGSRVARFDVASPGAAAMRVALQLAAPVEGLTVRAAGSDGAFGAYRAADIARATHDRGQFWTPDLAGDVATLELEAQPGVDVAGVTLVVPRLSHAVVGGAGLASPLAPVARATGIGAADTCNVDLACVASANPAAVDLAKSVAKLTFVGDDGRGYLCSGTLINDSVSSNTPYVFTADHCITSAGVAATLNTYWFYASQACDSKVSPPFVHLAGGARLLGRSQDHDWAIVELKETPPAGTKLAAWRAEAITVGTAVASLHHPAGDLIKFSRGQVTGDRPLSDDDVNADFTEVAWTSGITEGGSSGGALLTLASGGAFYEVRGGLYAGISSCSLPHAPDYYSHLETALPVMRQYLTPDAASPNGAVPAVEFYNRTLDHYFLSTNPVEIDNLDSGRTVGWVRTGLRFLAYDHEVAGTSPVCRFYRAPAYGDSHFYSASPDECAATAAAHPLDWIYESASVFWIQLPNATTGACPAGSTQPVYRFFNARTTNHRYTVEQVIRDQMDASPEWVPEGYGPGPFYPIMCAAMQ